MAKLIKAFVTRDDFINNTNGVISELFEISDKSLTYSKNKQQFYSSLNSLYSLYLFDIENGSTLLQSEVDSIINVVDSFVNFLSSTNVQGKSNIILSFINDFNTNNPSTPVTNLDYSQEVVSNAIKGVDYLTFSISDVDCSIWLNNNHFELFYPNYTIDIVLPFNNFASIITNVYSSIAALDGFDLLDFNVRIENAKNGNPTTYTRILNIPYKIPNTTTTKNCYFAFNIYGGQGNYEHTLKLALYDYLTNVLGLDPQTVETLFPSILAINEFFITPRWDKIAIPAQVGQLGINSQISLSYSEEFDLDKFVKIYTDLQYLKDNTYNVPFDYNNILLQVTNGYYTDPDIKDFKDYYSDLLTVTASHPDFSRMSARTQRFITLLKTMLTASNCNTSIELYNNIVSSGNSSLSIVTRAGVYYLTALYEQHRYYVIPKYEFFNNI